MYFLNDRELIKIDREILQYAIDHDIVDASTICQKVESMKRQEILDAHEFDVWRNEKGYYLTYVKDKNYKKGRRLIKKRVRADLDNEIIRHYESQQKSMYGAKFYEIMVEWAERKLGYGEIMKQTFDRYIYDYKRYAKGTILERKPIRCIDEDMLEDCLKKIIHDNEMTAKRWNTFKGMVNGTFKYAKHKGITDLNIRDFFDDMDISKRMFKKKIIQVEKEIFTDEEVLLIEDFIRNRPFSVKNMAILFAFQTGLRVGELSALKPSDINDHVLSVTRTEERFKDKNDKYVRVVRECTKGSEGFRYVVLTDRALEIVAEVNPCGEWLFETNGKRIKGNDISNKLYRICKQIGITPKSIHKVRKTYATNLLSAGIDEKLITSQMGHTDINLTKRFYYFNKFKTAETQALLESALQK